MHEYSRKVPIYFIFQHVFLSVIFVFFSLGLSYSCFHTLRWDFLTAAPQISPILFSDKIHEGMRAMASCNIIDGDPPMRVSWWRNGQPLRDGQDQNNVQLSNPSEYSSFLTINNVTRAYTGNYTCVANNNAAVSNYTAMLLVKG